MIIAVHWFWLIKLTLVATVGFFLYKAAKARFKSKFYNIAAITLIVISIVNPIKLAQPTTKAQQSYTANIQQTYSTLPDRVSDNSFKENASKPIITDDDLK